MTTREGLEARLGRRYRRLALAVFVLGIGVMALSALWPDAHQHGGRGGAVGVALALVAVWLRPSLGVRMIDAVAGPTPQGVKAVVDRAAKEAEDGDDPSARLRTAEIRIAALGNAIRVNDTTERESVAWLAISTIVGTLFWGFGDLGAQALRWMLVAGGLLGG